MGESSLPSSSGRGRIRAEVALAILETMRSQDLPEEVLQDEDLTMTLPRRLGLSDVIDAQIRRYREDARARRRIADSEFRDLVRLVIRRPDSEDIFLQVGEGLAGMVGREGRGWRRILPRGVAFLLARRRVRRLLRSLLGRSPGRLLPGRFVLETRNSLLVECDPGGDACSLVAGLSGAVLSRMTGLRLAVVEQECQARGGAVCRWVAVELDSGVDPGLRAAVTAASPIGTTTEDQGDGKSRG